MNKQTSNTGKQPNPYTSKTDTTKGETEKNLTNKEKGQDNNEEIQRQKRNADEDFEEKKVTGTTEQKDTGKEQKLQQTQDKTNTNQKSQSLKPQEEQEKEEDLDTEDDDFTAEEEEEDEPTA
jgi:hypothetical protein